MFHILDIDNTLFFTNELNNKAYIFALSSLGLKPLSPCKRITRTVIASWYPFLKDEEMIAIIRLKQIYVGEIYILSVLMMIYTNYYERWGQIWSDYGRLQIQSELRKF